MKLILVMVVASVAMAVAMATAIDSENKTTGVMVKICDDYLFYALHETCTKKNYDYLFKHATIYDKDNPYQPPDYHIRRGHKHEHNYDHGHDHDFGDDFDLLDLLDLIESYIEAKKQDESLIEKCCYKPCLIKDFLEFCGGF